MTHRNAPLNFEGRTRLIERCQYRPIAHVAQEMGIRRACASKWVNLYRKYGPAGLYDHPSTPHHTPTGLPAHVLTLVEGWRRHKKWTAARIQAELAYGHEVHVHVRTISRHLHRLGLNRLRWIDPVTGQVNRQRPGKIIARWPGHMIHVDVKKLGVSLKVADTESMAVTALRTKGLSVRKHAVPGLGMSISTPRSMGSPVWRIPSL